MRRAKRWRYYCDFCKTSKGQKAAMIRHEKGCTANPDRQCGLCDLAGLHHDLTELTGFIDETCEGEDQNDLHGESVAEVLKELEDKTEQCPACTLAAIRQARIKIFPDFNFKEKMEAWWIEENAAQAERECRY